MDKPVDAPASVTREERLAARLRDNLRRRKAQARALSGGAADGRSESRDANAALSKPAPKS